MPADDATNAEAAAAREALVRGLRVEAERVAHEMTSEDENDHVWQRDDEDRLMLVIRASAIADALNRVEGLVAAGESTVSLTPHKQ